MLRKNLEKRVGLPLKSASRSSAPLHNRTKRAPKGRFDSKLAAYRIKILYKNQ
jgi:hypothetical protein